MQPKPLERHKAYDFKILPLAEEDGGGFLIFFPDLPGCVSDGNTIEEAIINGRMATQDWLEACKHWNRKTPKPLFKTIKDGEIIKLSDGTTIGINRERGGPATEAEKALAVDEAMKEFLGV